MDMEIAEAPAEGNVLRGRQILIAENQDAVVEMGLLDAGEGVVRQWSGEIDAYDFGAERRRKRANVDRRFHDCQGLRIAKLIYGSAA
jgi:hypothetical protein